MAMIKNARVKMSHGNLLFCMISINLLNGEVDLKEVEDRIGVT